MEYNMKRLLFLLPALLFALNLFARENEYDVIYAINFFDGLSYNSTIIPHSVREINIQADHVNAFVVRETSLYYWPLTSEFKADWAARNIPLEGTLCIKSVQGKIERIKPQRYAIQYDMKDIPGTIAVYWGTEANSKYTEFAAAQRSYSEAVFAYNQAMRDYDRQISDFLQNKDNDPSLFPEVPIAPENFTLMSTDVNIGFQVNLSRGTYRIYFEDPLGRVMPETRKRLRVFNPLEKTGGFQVFEEGRWSVPANFPDSHMTLFAVSGKKIYLQPFDYLHYRGRDYNLMVNPQSRYSENEYSVWVPVSLNAEHRTLALGTEELSLLGYKVTQLAGSKLGYIINPIAFGDDESSFSAFHIEIPEHSSGKTYALGESSRLSIVRVFGGMELIILFISLMPLIIFTVIFAMMRQKTLTYRRN
jgi:hypothetical protein